MEYYGSMKKKYGTTEKNYGTMEKLWYYSELLSTIY